MKDDGLSLRFDELPGLLDRASRRQVTRFEVEAGGMSLRISLRGARPAQADPGGAARVTLASEGLGRFLARHPARDQDGQTPPLAVGAQIAPGQIIAFLATGSLLLPVVARHGGRVARLLVAEGDLVEFATPLLEVDPA